LALHYAAQLSRPFWENKAQIQTPSNCASVPALARGNAIKMKANVNRMRAKRDGEAARPESFTAARILKHEALEPKAGRSQKLEGGEQKRNEGSRRGRFRFQPSG